MRFAQAVAHLLLLVVGAQAFRTTHRRSTGLESRGNGSGSRSPSPDHSSSGLLGDVVKHALKAPQGPTGTLHDIVRQGTQRPASSTHAGQTSHAHGYPFVGHPSQAASHAAHPSSSSEAHAHVTGQAHLHSAQLSQQVLHGHPVNAPHSHPAQSSQQILHGLPVRLHPTPQNNPAQTSQSRTRTPSRKTLTRPAPEAIDQHLPSFGKLGKAAAAVRSKPYVKPSQAKRPEGTPAPPKKPTGQWWKIAGGRPKSQYGSSPYYEINKKYRDNAKARKAQAQGSQPHDEHPSGHKDHPPHGGGPGSPSAGSHAVSKRGGKSER